MKHYHAKVPLPPSINGQNKFVKNGRIIQTDNCREWKKAAFYYFKDFPRVPPGTKWNLILDFTFHFVSRPRRIDTDNRLKPLFDAIATKIGSDDENLINYSVKRTALQVQERIEDYVNVHLSVAECVV